MKTYQGIHVPIITPFSHGQIDWGALAKVIDHYKATKVASIIPCGTTGESCTLSHEEHRAVIEFTVQRAGKDKAVIAGTGSNSTEEACELTAFAARVGARAALVVAPYYNRPTQEGIYQYYLDIARAVPGFDLLIYNIPARTGVNVDFDTVRRLAKIPAYKGIKEGTGNVQTLKDLAYEFSGRDFSVLTGEDSLLLDTCAYGGDGGVMASAGVIPNELVDLVRLVEDGRLKEARALDRVQRPLIQALFGLVNPTLVKFAVARMLGLPYELRRPLLPADEQHRRTVIAAMERASLAGGLPQREDI